MAGLRGNIANLIAQKQTALGTAATWADASSVKNAFSGGSIGPVREVNQLSETDSSRDIGVSFASTTGVEGSPEVYVRDESISFWLWAALGASAVTGTTNYTHTVTPANALPYLTVWKSLGGTLFEQYQDCKVGSLSIKAEAGQPLTATIGINGRQSTRLTAAIDNATPKTIENSLVYNYNKAAVTLGGSATAMVRSFEINIENNLTRQQTDDFIALDVYEGTREVTVSFDLIFDSLPEYNKFHYGSPSGTTVSDQVFTTSLQLDFAGVGANNNINFSLPNIAYTEFPVEPQPGGDAVVSSVAATAQRGGSPVLTAVVKNQHPAW